MFSNLKIRIKILSAFFVITLLTLILGLFSLLKTGTVNDETVHLAKKIIPSITAMSIIDSQINLNRRGEIQACTKTTPEELEKYAKRQSDTLDKVQKAISVYEKLSLSTDEKRAFDNLKILVTAYYKDSAKTFETAKTGDLNETINVMRTISKKSYDAAQKSALELIEAYNKEAVIAEQHSQDVYTSSKYWIVGTILLCVIIAILLGLIIASAISKPLTKLLSEVNKVATGDLRVNLERQGNDEIGELTNAFAKMVQNTRSIVAQISSTSTQVAAASSQLHHTAQKIANGAESVSSQVDTVATADEEISATSNDIAHNCQMAADGAQRALVSASNGAEVVEKTVLVMGQIADKVQESARTVESLGARSDQIGAIIGTIEDIADQTNLLALNAAIEAARAGEQGRGFAVVADEVRALAERTTRATKEIDEMIKSIQRETKNAVTAMEQGVQQVESGTDEAARSGGALRDILSLVNDVAMQVNQIAIAAEEQTTTTASISSNMLQITDVVHQTTSGAQESAAAAVQLKGNAEELHRLVQQFIL